MSVKVRPYRNGGFEVDILWRAPDGRRQRERKRLSTTSKSAAQRWGEQRERQLLVSGPVTKKKEVPTLKEFATRFFNDHPTANRHKPSGIASKETVLRIHLLPLLGDKRLDAINSADVQQLKARMASKAPKTVNNTLTVLNVVLKKAVEWSVIERLPCNGTLLPVTRKEATFHDFEAYERLVSAARVKGWRTHLIVLLGAEAGLRAGEMVALEWKDVDAAQKRLRVRQSAWRGQLTTPKNGKERLVPLTDRLAGALAQYHHLRGPRVLCKDSGEPLSRQSAWTRVRRAAKQAKVPTGVHILRHTFCSHLAMRGAPGRSIQELAGHQELSMTQRYMHLSQAALNDAIRLLEPPQRSPPRGDIVETADRALVS